MNRILLFSVIFFLFGCRGTKEIMTDYQVQRDTVYISKVQKDTISLDRLDSVFVNQYVKGDTVFRDKYRTVIQVKYKEKTAFDTIYVAKNDTIIREKKVEVIKKSSDKALRISLCILSLVILFLLGYVYRQKMK